MDQKTLLQLRQIIYMCKECASNRKIVTPVPYATESGNNNTRSVTQRKHYGTSPSLSSTCTAERGESRLAEHCTVGA
jgi:hypothetical protein